MSRMHRLRRRQASASAAIHVRARTLAAERLGSPLTDVDASWLDEHLAGCPGCRSIAAAYEADRMALRGLRDYQPEAPRDMWARTAAALERESSPSSGVTGRPTTRRSRSGPALGIASGVLVIAVVIGASVLSGGFNGGPTIGVVPAASAPGVAIASTATPGPTPIVVGAGSVGWVGTSPNGDLAYNVTPVRQVCPAERQPDCALVSDSDSKTVNIDIQPKSISQSPVRNQAVVVGTDPQGKDSVLVIALPTPEPTPTPVPSIEPSVAPTETPATPSTTATSEPPASASTTPQPTPSPSVSATPAVTPSATPTVTAEPTIAATLAIVSGVKVVGESAAFSPDGAWFAFTARPSDDSAGPDIYLWHVGDALARPLTSDHQSVFASWAGARVLGSRPTAATAGADSTTEVEPRSFFLDPATGDETAIAAPAWRPIVAPAGDRAVVWVGTVKRGGDGMTTVPAAGSLVLRGFSAVAGPDPGDAIAPVVVEGPVAEYDVRWDETGTWLAVWVADATDPTVGRLSLLHLDPATGQLERLHGAPQDVTALPGFSIADKRLAWATPPGQGGEGSRVQIVAWSDQTVGGVQSAPVEGVVVVH
jgi:hypothetical protein